MRHRSKVFAASLVGFKCILNCSPLVHVGCFAGFLISGDSQAAIVHRPIPGRGVIQTSPSVTTPVASQPDMTTPTGGESTSRRRAEKLNKNGNWSTVSLQAALRAVDNGSRILTASQKYGIPVSTLRNHLFGLTTSRKRGKPGVLTREEEEEVVSYIKTMASIGHPLTLRQLRLKVAEMTQVRLTPFPNGIPGLSWVKWFRRRHPDLSLLVAQGVETGRARGLCPENVYSFYENLVEAYQEQKYPASQIWNADESGAQAGRTGGAMVVASKGAKQAHSVELDEREHVTVLSCINAEGQSIPNFYIFKGHKFKSNYIRGCESGACMAMQPKGWMTSFLFDKWMSHFVTCVQAMGGNMSPNNRHVLIIDGQNSHVTVDIVLQARTIGLDLITIPAHTSHALQPLDVSCFKPFKTAFRACRDMWSIEHKGVNARKEDLANWVSRGLKKALTPQNIRAGFRATGIWPLDATKMDKKMAPSEEDGPEHEGDEEEDVGEVPIEEMMLDLVEEVSVVGGCHYVVDVDEESNSTRADLQDASIIGSTQQSQMEGGSAITRFLPLPIVTEPSKRRKNTSEPIIDYSKSIFMTSDAYIAQLEAKLKAIEETEKERARRMEEMERNETKRAAEKLEKEAEKRMRTERREAKKRFDAQWTVTRISEIGDALHKAIRMRYPIPQGAYKGKFCGMAPKICRDNQKIVMERRKLKKQGLDTRDLATVEPTWVYKPNPLTTPENFVLCSIVPA